MPRISSVAPLLSASVSLDTSMRTRVLVAASFIACLSTSPTPTLSTPLSETWARPPVVSAARFSSSAEALQAGGDFSKRRAKASASASNAGWRPSVCSSSNRQAQARMVESPRFSLLLIAASRRRMASRSLPEAYIAAASVKAAGKGGRTGGGGGTGSGGGAGVSATGAGAGAGSGSAFVSKAPGTVKSRSIRSSSSATTLSRLLRTADCWGPFSINEGSGLDQALIRTSPPIAIRPRQQTTTAPAGRSARKESPRPSA